MMLEYGILATKFIVFHISLICQPFLVIKFVRFWWHIPLKFSTTLTPAPSVPLTPYAKVLPFYFRCLPAHNLQFLVLSRSPSPPIDIRPHMKYLKCIKY